MFINLIPNDIALFLTWSRYWVQDRYSAFPEDLNCITHLWMLLERSPTKFKGNKMLWNTKRFMKFLIKVY